jgi:hypothetical protein
LREDGHHAQDREDDADAADDPAATLGPLQHRGAIEFPGPVGREDASALRADLN